MRDSHKAAYRTAARATLEWCGIPVGADFHTLSSAQVDRLLACADREGYRKPRGANGSRARYYHDKMQRHARP